MRMGILARIGVVPRLPHRVTKPGNRCQQRFFVDEDQAGFRRPMAASFLKCSVEVLAWCLTPSHLHLVMVPSTDDGLRCPPGEAHRC